MLLEKQKETESTSCVSLPRWKENYLPKTFSSHSKPERNVQANTWMEFAATFHHDKFSQRSRPTLNRWSPCRGVRHEGPKNADKATRRPLVHNFERSPNNLLSSVHQKQKNFNGCHDGPGKNPLSWMATKRVS